MKGKLIIISAPSGSGKTTIVNHLLHQGLNLNFSVSATSRKPRPGEENGKNYYFLTREEFQKKINNDEFLEWEEVYKGICYGTLKSEVDKIRESGKNVIMDVDVVGGVNIKKIYGKEALSIFIKPPSLTALKERLQKRSTETPAKIKMRIDKAAEELLFAGKFDAVIINDNLQIALNEAEKLVSDFISRH
ncbi:MAG: guanylate kinase [Prolixibacteraceae bacterium]|jgi:guanylate kinase|nr:guanylate kinase [Prolixibacteraceae bacterium]